MSRTTNNKNNINGSFHSSNSSTHHDPTENGIADTSISNKNDNASAQYLEAESANDSTRSMNFATMSSRSINWSTRTASFGADMAEIHEGPNAEALLHQKYQLMEVLGVGSTSTVYRCTRKESGSEYACKVIDCALIEERFAGMMEQFQREIEALRQLKHPNIIRLYDVYLALPHKIYIVMELMQGGELFDYVVEKGTLTEEEASAIVRQVTSALVYMHSLNIVHRDLKPENLLLKKPMTANTAANATPTTTNKNNNNNSGNNNKSLKTPPMQVKIIDFGLSKLLEAEPVARTFLGTRGYLAPEMLQRRDYTKGVDTWALGVIVFVLVCGCLPFDDDSSTIQSDDLVRAKFVLRFPRWAKNLSASAKDLLAHLLDVNPRTRYTAEQALAHPWVQGVTASNKNMLASPKRIQISPNVRESSNARRYSRSPKQPTPPAVIPPPRPKTQQQQRQVANNYNATKATQSSNTYSPDPNGAQMVRQSSL